MASSMSSSSSQARSTQSNLGENLEVVEIIPCSRAPEIFAHYDLCKMSNGSKLARCKHCSKFFKSESNSSLKNHTEKACKALKSGTTHGQADMTTQGGVFTYNAEKVREGLAKLVISKGLPFDHFDDERMTKMIQTLLQPRYTHVSRATLRRDALKMWRDAKNQMILGFEQHKFGVSLTCDVWTSPHNTGNSYLAVTAHWFDQQNWQQNKRTIAFELFGEPHTADNLFGLLRYIICTYKLECKILTISYDNASNNTAAVPRLKVLCKPILEGVFFHTRCVAHIINLIVQSGLTQIEPLTVEFRTMLKSVLRKNNRRLNHYRKFCKSVGKKALGASLDCPTRWNSTWLMFDNALRQRETLQVYHNNMVSKGFASQEFTNEQWDIILKVRDYLELFKEATILLSGVYYPTSPLVLNQIYILSQKIGELEFEGEMLEKVGDKMKNKMLKYFKNIPPVFMCAAALNPTINHGGVEMLIESIAQNLGVTELEPNFVTEQQALFNKCLTDMFDIYLRKYGPINTIQSQLQSSQESSSRRSNPTINLYNALMNNQSKRARTTSTSSELGLYIGGNFIQAIGLAGFENFNLLSWWSEHESQFPILAAMARDLLSVQASTVASESAFSTSGRIISARRSRLSPESVECCICLKDYLDGVERRQHVESLEDAIDVDMENNLVEDEVESGISTPDSNMEIANLDEDDEDEEEDY